MLQLCASALQYRHANPEAVHRQILETLRTLVEHLDNFPPLVTSEGVITAKDWLKSNGVDLRLFGG